MSKKPLQAQARKIIFNVYNKIREEEGADKTEKMILNRVHTLTGVTTTTLRRIATEGRLNEGIFNTPGTGRNGRKKKIILDNFDQELVRNKIKEFYTVRKEIPTIMKLLRILILLVMNDLIKAYLVRFLKIRRLNSSLGKLTITCKLVFKEIM